MDLYCNVCCGYPVAIIKRCSYDSDLHEPSAHNVNAHIIHNISAYKWNLPHTDLFKNIREIVLWANFHSPFKSKTVAIICNDHGFLTDLREHGKFCFIDVLLREFAVSGPRGSRTKRVDGSLQVRIPSSKHITAVLEIARVVLNLTRSYISTSQ